MSYCVADDVQKEFAGVDFSATGAKVTTDDVNGWIEESDAYIDSKISTIYRVPVSGAPKSLLVLKTISILIVSDRVERKLGVKSSAQEVDTKGGDIPLLKRAEKMLEDIMKETLVLTDAPKGNSTDGVSSPSIASPCPPERVFKKDKTQW